MIRYASYASVLLSLQMFILAKITTFKGLITEAVGKVFLSSKGTLDTLMAQQIIFLLQISSKWVQTLVLDMSV